MLPDHAVVGTAAAQHREEGVAGRAPGRATGQPSVGFHVPGDQSCANGSSNIGDGTMALRRRSSCAIALATRRRAR